MQARASSLSPFSGPVLAALNHVLQQAEWARERLRPFSGRVVRLGMPPFVFTCAVDAGGLLQASDAEPDLDVALPANAPLLALQGQDAVMKAARIEGPADLADALSFVLRNLRWDIEEDLSRLVGDVAARRVVRGMTGVFDWQRDTVRRLGENIGEYLVHENPTLVQMADFNAFARDLQQLSSKLSLLETRVHQIREKKP